MRRNFPTLLLHRYQIKMKPRNQNSTSEDETQIVSRRIQRLSFHLSPIGRSLHESNQLGMMPCARTKVEVNKEKLSLYMRGKHREIQEKVFAYFKSRPELQTPVEISRNEHRELCWRQLLGLVREAGIRPLKYISEDPAIYFAILEAAGSVDISLGIKMGVQYSLWGGSIINIGTKKHRDKYFDGIDNLDYPGCFAMTELHHGSNVQGLQTIATFDPLTDEFVINTPHDGAIKWWIGNAAVHGKVINHGKEVS
ncbi:acyl-CoA oxidase, putative [Ricinus communis]|uniref:Acyl-CoA oxidase, putative n=1 Tax=Ricinus communis TaxID=3988 RepID=B9T4G4_RICCO|nr:acyl-CoA oxidase, putative [Ricinus communis]